MKFRSIEGNKQNIYTDSMMSHKDKCREEK